MSLRALVVITVLMTGVAAAQAGRMAPAALPGMATQKLSQSLAAAAAHRHHVWRDGVPRNPDGTVNAYIEIARGDRRKWELDMRTNERAVDRVMPESIGGYPVNYGFVPQTVSYDGDPFDALVLGPPIDGGETVSGVVVGLMYMEDEKGLDSKVVLARPGPDGKPLQALTDADQKRIGDYFRKYKEHEAGAYSAVPGWGLIEEGTALVTLSHAFFLQCRERPGQVCTVRR